MPAVERCVTTFTAGTFAVVYVLLLVGFTHEFYAARGRGLPAVPAAGATGVLPVARRCVVEPTACADEVAAAGGQPACALSIRGVQQLLLAR